MSPEDSLTMALVGMLDSKQMNNKTKNSKSKKEKEKEGKKTDEPKKPLSDEEYKKLKELRIADWKKKVPNADKSKTKEVDGHTYHFVPNVEVKRECGPSTKNPTIMRTLSSQLNPSLISLIMTKGSWIMSKVLGMDW